VTTLKAIVVCLALANVAYYLWARGIAHPEGANANAATGASLRLASEVPGSQRGAPTPAGGETSDAAGEGSAGAIVGATGGSEAPTTAAGDLLTSVKRCISVGPFRDVAEAAHAASTLRSGGYDPRQRVAEGEVWAGVWVYLPVPQGSTAEQILAKLKAGGVDDALEMPGPNDGPVVSLGLYNDSKRAQVRVVQAQSIGFNPGIADRKRSGDVYWIDIDLKPTDSVLKPSDLQSGESGHIVRLEVKACPTNGAQP
jgi:hypothetical protein